MGQRFALGVALAIAASGACAEDWQFTYTGFNVNGVFDGNAQLTGSFSGSDLDQDGKIVLSELTALQVQGRPYLEGCLSLSDPYFRCAIDAFSYLLTGQLAVDVYGWGNDEAFSGWSWRFRTGDRYSYWSYGWNDYENHMLWTPETQFAITPAPIPEPLSGLMMLAGLATLAGVCRRRAGEGFSAT